MFAPIVQSKTSLRDVTYELEPAIGVVVNR
jgi:hypothetical protein